MSALPQPRLTVAAYLEIERAAEFRSEYFNGQMYAMSGGSLTHAFVIQNIARQLGNRIAGTGCRLATADMRVATGPNGLYTYPDIVVVCGKPQVLDSQNDTLLNPAVLIEVLSPSTEAYDRGLKAQQFRTIASLRELALVSQTEAHVEIYRRAADGSWSLNEWTGLQAEARFDSLNLSIPLGEIYSEVEFIGAAETLTARPAAARRTRSARSSRR